MPIFNVSSGSFSNRDALGSHQIGNDSESAFIIVSPFPDSCGKEATLTKHVPIAAATQTNEYKHHTEDWSGKQWLQVAPKTEQICNKCMQLCG